MRASGWRLLAGRFRAPSVADGTGREGRFAACGLEGLSGSHQPYSLLSRLSQVLDGSSGLHTPAAGAGCVQASPGPDMHAHLRPLTLVRAFNTSSGSLSSGSGSSSNSTSDIEPPSPATDFAARGSSSGKDCGSSNSSSNSTSGGGRAAAGPRGKAAARAKAAAAAAAAAQSLLPAAHHAHPAARGAKGKAGKAPGAKAAAASVAVKSGGQRPLSVEARRQLDLQLEGLAAQGVVGGGASRKPAVKAVGFYIGQAIRPDDVTLLLHQLDTRPPPGVVAGDTFRHTDHTVLLLRPAPHTHYHHQHDTAAEEQAGAAGGGKAEQGQGQGQGRAVDAAAAAGDGAAAEGGAEAPSRQQQQQQQQQQELAGTGSCQAVVLHEYGGVAFFNVPPHLMSDLLQRIVRIVIPSTALMAVRATGSSSGSSTGSSSSSSGSSSSGASGGGGVPGAVYAGGGSSSAASQQQRPELLLHSEEEEFVIDESVDRAPRLQRFIRKEGDAYIVSRWDSVNMESVARVLSQSAAIRHYNQICEDMLRRYMSLVPADTPYLEPPEGRAATAATAAAAAWLRLLRWLSAWRQRRGGGGGGRGGQQQHSGQLPLKQLRRMVAESTTIHVFLESSLLGVAEPPTSTWASARHHKVWDVVHDEFELDDRQELLVGKAALIKQSCLDLINAHNDTFAKRSEITIIALIATEIVISLCGLHDLVPLRALLGGGGGGGGH